MLCSRRHEMQLADLVAPAKETTVYVTRTSRMCLLHTSAHPMLAIRSLLRASWALPKLTTVQLIFHALASHACGNPTQVALFETLLCAASSAVFPPYALRQQHPCSFQPVKHQTSSSQHEHTDCMVRNRARLQHCLNFLA